MYYDQLDIHQDKALPSNTLLLSPSALALYCLLTVHYVIQLSATPLLYKFTYK